MPITIKNSAGGGVTLDSSTSSNETINLNTPVFTGNVGIGTSSPSEKLSVLGGHVSIGESSGSSATKMLLEGYREIYSGSKYGNISIRSTYNTTSNASDMLFYTAPSGTTSTEHMRIHSSGDVSFGDPLTVAQLIADGEQGVAINGPSGVLAASRFNDLCAIFKRENSSGATVNFMRDATIVGHIDVGTSSTSYNTSSDYRLKTNVTPMSGATAQTKLLKPCNFDWIAGGNVNGFIAHELAEVVPEAVTGTKDAMRDEEYEVTAATDTEAAVMGTRSVPDLQGIDQAKLVPLLTATIQELIARIEALENV